MRQLATQANVTFTAGERLAQELQLIEAGIRERERDVRNWTVAATTPYCTAPTSAATTTLPLCCQQPAVDNDLLASQDYSRDYKTQEEVSGFQFNEGIFVGDAECKTY